MNKARDRLPEEYEEVLVFSAAEGEWDIGQLVLGVWTSTVSGEECYPVTHWQELVAPDDEDISK